MASRLTVGGLFSGIGGWELGLERAGMEIAWHCEADPFCRRVLEKHWPGVPTFGDVCTLNAGMAEGVDVLCGGPPCQPVSGAGLGLGDADDRWLWPDTLRLVSEFRPRYVLLENPAILLRRGADGILGTLAELGYDAEWEVVSACAFGASHTRRRVFIVAYPEGERCDGWWSGDTSAQSVESAGRDPGDGWPWTTEPRPFGVAHGVPARVDRLRSLGNALVPQIAQWIGQRIVSYEVGAGYRDN